MKRSFNLFGREVLSWGEDDSKIDNRTVKNALSRKQSYAVNELSLEMRRKVALKEPLILKAIQKKNKDTLRNWFDIKTDEGKQISTKLFNMIQKFESESNLRYKLYVAGVSANIYGTGFLEIIYNEPTGTPADAPVKSRAKPINVRVLDSECITEQKNKDNEDKTLYWVYKEKGNPDEVLVHPDRIIDVSIDKLPFNEFGISKIDVLANILQSKMNADIAAGETLAWFSTGILDMTIQSMDDEQEKAMLKLFTEHPHYYVHDEDYVLDIKNPTRIDPKPFYDYFYTNIAAAMEMPVTLLVGQAEGAADVGISDYYHDLENIQEVIFTPIIKKLYTRLLKYDGFNWNYQIKWNPVFVDELAEGKIMQVRAYSATTALNSGVIDVPEARNMLVNGVVDLDLDKTPKPKPMPTGTPSTDQPNINPQPATKKPTAKVPTVSAKASLIVPLSDASKKMIEEAAKRERQLGKEILKEQEKL